jgi:RNA recognition motif-containing protein
MSTKSNLIVNYVANEVTDAEFREWFSKYGSMQNCKLVKDKISGLSVGYGFVKYETDDCAQLAIQGMNGKQFGGKRIKVSVARPEGVNNKDEKAALFIGGMPKSYTEADLQGMFAAFGLVEEVKIFSDTNTGMSRAGSAFVRMDSAASARAVIASLNGKPMQGGTTLTVKEFTPRAKQNGDGNAAMYALEGAQMQSYAVFPAAFEQAGYGQQAAYADLAAYGGYAPSALDPYTADYTAQAGYPQQSGALLSYGGPQAVGYEQQAQPAYGYAQVPQGYGAPPATGAYGGKTSNGYQTSGPYGQQQSQGYGAQTRQPSFAQNRFNPMGARPQQQTGGQAGVDSSNNTLFIFHLPTEMTEDALRQMFASFGAIVDISVVRNKEDGTSRGFGFVTFSSHKEAQTAMDQMNGHQVGGKFLKVSFKK